MPRYWFKPRQYGCGATPVTWQGWTITIAIVLADLVSLFLHFAERRNWALAALLAFDAVAMGALFVISYWKIDGEWRWCADNKG